MDSFWQGAAAVLIGCILAIILGKQGKDTALLLTLSVCCMVGLLAVRYLRPVVDFMEQLAQTGNLENDMLQVLLKVVGIGLVGELATLICTDAGSSSLGKSVQLLTSAAIIWLSLPIFTRLLELLQEILGGL